jgi:hypothetical protein
MKRGEYGRATDKTESARGGMATFAKCGAFRVTVNLSPEAFGSVKIAALENNRSISAEINSRVESKINE